MQMTCVESIARLCYNASNLHMNIKLTKKRQEILNAIKCSTEPLSATAIHQKLDDVDLVTVYRNLDLFVQEKLVQKLQFSDEAVYEYQQIPHHHAICDNCEKLIHFSIAEEDLKKIISVKDFSISNIDITVKGTCAHEATKV